MVGIRGDERSYWAAAPLPHHAHRRDTRSPHPQIHPPRRSLLLLLLLRLHRNIHLRHLPTHRRRQADHHRRLEDRHLNRQWNVDCHVEDCCPSAGESHGQ